MGRTKGGFYCPDCFEQVSSSCKICDCGGTPTPRKTSSTYKKSSSATSPGVKIRRTERIKRGKPDYYDPLEYERQAKKERKLRASSGRNTTSTLAANLKNGKGAKEQDSNYNSHRMQLKTKKKKKRVDIEPPKEEELEEIVLSQETIAKFSLILEEINRKIYASSWRVYND